MMEMVKENKVETAQEKGRSSRTKKVLIEEAIANCKSEHRFNSI